MYPAFRSCFPDDQNITRSAKYQSIVCFPRLTVCPRGPVFQVSSLAQIEFALLIHLYEGMVQTGRRDLSWDGMKWPPNETHVKIPTTLGGYTMICLLAVKNGMPRIYPNSCLVFHPFHHDDMLSTELRTNRSRGSRFLQGSAQTISKPGEGTSPSWISQPSLDWHLGKGCCWVAQPVHNPGEHCREERVW